MTSVYETQEAWFRFQELTRGHKGLRDRLEALGMLTKVMNAEEFGIESLP